MMLRVWKYAIGMMLVGAVLALTIVAYTTLAPEGLRPSLDNGLPDPFVAQYGAIIAFMLIVVLAVLLSSLALGTRRLGQVALATLALFAAGSGGFVFVSLVLGWLRAA